MDDSQTLPVVCISQQEWEAPLQTNRQRICEQLAISGHRVLFVETGSWFGGIKHIGNLRLRRLRRVLGAESIAPNIKVHRALNPAPFSWRSRWAVTLNAWLLAKSLGHLLRASGLSPALILLYDPRGIETANRLGSLAVIYDCVDDHAQQLSGRTRRLVGYFDGKAARDADAVAVTAAPLLARHTAVNPHTELIPNVADFQHFSHVRPPGRADGQMPVIGFAGNIVPLKVDLDVIATLALENRQWTFMLVGPVAKELDRKMSRLATESNVISTGRADYQDLPGYLAKFDVGLIPYLRNGYTESCFPLKLYEYLASGLPVVVSGLPSVPAISGDVLHAEGAAGIANAIQRALDKSTGPDIDRRRSLAARHTWSDRAQSLRRLALEAIDRRR